MDANYQFSSTPGFWDYAKFNGFPVRIPNTTVPSTEWTAGTGGTTKMCFDKVVSNPILIISSLGSPSIPVSLSFSTPFEVIYNGGGINSFSDTTISGQEGYAVILFPGDFQCVTIYSTTPESYTNISWGINPPLFPVKIEGPDTGCGMVTLKASGGQKYQWTGGNNPTSSINTFNKSGIYSLTITDINGCIVKTSRQINIASAIVTDTTVSICKGENFYGYFLPGRYLDTIRSTNGCDTIRKITLSVNAVADKRVSKVICVGQSYLGYTVSGSYTDTIRSVNGCDSLVITTDLTVLDNCDPSFPNAFTPNGDGKNELFRVINGQQAEGFHLTIFNRFGQKVFEAVDPGAGWNGRFQGLLQGRGIYTWVCSFKQAGIRINKKGFVMLIN